MIKKLNTNTSLDKQIKWELLKYEIRRFAMSYLSNALKKMKEKKVS